MIYLDHAATSWPKAPPVFEAMKEACCQVGGNPGRGGHEMGLEAGRRILAARQQVAELLGVGATRIVFTKNTTEALNLALFGILKPGDRVVTSSVEHNSILRPLAALEKRGVEVEVLPAPGGRLDLDALAQALKKETRLVVLSHASNVTGDIIPLAEVAELVRSSGALFLADIAQSLGYLPVKLGELPVDLAAFPGHKGLLGPLGTGGLYIRSGIVLEPLIYGGTGSYSDSVEQPEILPDRYESGTPNLPGILGLGAAAEFVRNHGSEIAEKSLALAQEFRQRLSELEKVKIYGPEKLAVPLISVNFGQEASEEVARVLSEFFQIAVRGGLHCAPLAHRTIGTETQGTVRFSFGYGNTQEDVEAAYKAAVQICLQL